MRIRSIKPEFWTSQDIADLPWEARLIFIGLWSYVDDNGVGRDNDKLVAAQLFPLEDDPRETIARVSRGLQQLSAASLITRYMADGHHYLSINTWDKHQRIDRPNKPRYPRPTRKDAESSVALATHSRDSRETPAPGAGEQGNRGRKDSHDAQFELVPPPDNIRPITKPTRYPDDFQQWYDHYPRKTAKADALKAWDSARRKADLDTLCAAADRYAATITDPKFAAYPATWLNREQWLDEPTTPAATGTRPEEDWS